MSDTAETAPEPTPPAEAAQPDVDWKARAREWEKRAKDNAKAAARLSEIEDAQKTQSEKDAERIAALESEAAQARAEALRLRVGTQAGLSPELIDRLKGSTEDEIAADAAQLAELVKPQRSPLETRPTSTLKSGTVPDATEAPENPEAAFRSFLGQSLG